MKLISHRGNLTGPNPQKENSIEYIQRALDEGYDVEIDVRAIDQDLYLGHDEPQYLLDLHFVNANKDRLWLHCKDITTLLRFNQLNLTGICYNYFWHETDTVTLTSKGFIWAYPGRQPIVGSVAVMPELYNDDFSKCYAVCSDFIQTIYENRNLHRNKC